MSSDAGGVSSPGWRAKDAAALLLFFLLWLLPIAYAGFNGGAALPGLPRALADLTNASCLFIHTTPFSAFDYIQVQPQRDVAWQTVPMEDYFRMAPFGYRTRLDEYARKGALEGPALDELALWIRSRYAQLNAGRAPAGVRLVAVALPATRQVPVGRWRRPPLEAFPPDVPRVWLTRFYETGRTAAAPPDE